MVPILGDIPVLGLYMFTLSALALQPGRAFFGHEPERVHRFHKEQQTRLRTRTLDDVCGRWVPDGWDDLMSARDYRLLPGVRRFL